MFRSLKEFVVRKLGGYCDAEEAIQDIADDEEKHRILTLAVRKLFCGIGPDDILKQTSSGDVIFKGKAMRGDQMAMLQAESMQVLASKTWEILQEDVKYQAEKMMFVKSKTPGDLIFGKAVLFVLDIFKTRLTSLQSGSANFNSKK